MKKGMQQTAMEPKDDSSKKHMIKSAVTQETSVVPNTQTERKRSSESTADERDEQRQDRATIQVDGNMHPTAPPSPSKKASLSAQPLADGDNAKAFDWMGEGRFHLTGHPNPETKRGSSPAMYHDFKHPNSPTSQRGDYRSHANHEESSSYLLFTNSFDTISESGDSLAHTGPYREHASPLTPFLASHNNAATPRIDIALPALGRSESECSLMDVSPIKVANRPQPPVLTPAGAADTFHRSLANSGQYPPRHIPQMSQGRFTGPSSVAGGIQSVPARVHGGYHWRPHPGYPTHGGDNVSNPFYVIRSCQRAFAGCTYLLPCLREHMISVNLNRYGHIRRYDGNPEKLDVDSMELVMATRRVETAICVFGGNLNQRRSSHTSSIFRLKDAHSGKHRYEQQLPKRYQVNESRISWDVEADPPVDLERAHMNEQGRATKRGQGRSDSTAKGGPHVIVDDTPSGKRAGHGRSSSPITSEESAENEKKLKYRCKLCGQPKQNHNCTFRQSLQRSIGIQVYSAVNAYTACEPGTLAPNLSTMNNFVSNDTSSMPFSSAPEEGSNPTPSTVTPQVTREGGSGAEIHSPQSSLSTHSPGMSPGVEPRASSMSGGSDNRPPGTGHYHVHFEHPGATRAGDKKRSHAQMEGNSKPYHHTIFAQSVALRPEQYRAVTSFRNEDGARMTTRTNTPGAYHYPAVPVPFAERKRLSDTLFHFSQEIPDLARDCGTVLHEARERGDWDQAVAELLTQVVVGLYCGEGDTQLDGLQQYLLTLGVSC